ncbi:MAG: hypothetical protein WCO82_00325 [Sphingomonadales bacterium]|jgi:hypothetical protein
MTPLVQEIVRRAILDLLTDIGGEHNDEVLAALLLELGHRVARRDVRVEMAWLASGGFITTEELGPYLVARVLADGRDVAEGNLVVEGIRKFKTGD